MVVTGPTRGASEDRAWKASPRKAFAVRTAIAVTPFVASFLIARGVAGALWRPAGWVGTAVFILQIAVVGSATALLAERAARRLLPLASLLNMTLVFPDRAPSRFGIALRSRTVRQIRDGSLALPTDQQQAAEELLTMVSALSRHERLTRGHTERVRAYADVIAEQMELTESDRQLLAWGAMVHDVGKLAVPAEILTAERRPTDEEWEILKQHPGAGAEIVESLRDWLGEWRLAAGEHHERWDGKGYPNGLVGTETSLAGRIVAVADAYDVITSKRSYKTAMSAEAAREEMVRCSGGQFDPQVVRALLQASLTRHHRKFDFLGWLVEAGGRTRVPDYLGQGVAASLAAAALVATAVVGSPSIDTDLSAVAPLESGFSNPTTTDPAPTPLVAGAAREVTPDAAPSTTDPAVTTTLSSQLTTTTSTSTPATGANSSPSQPDGDPSGSPPSTTAAPATTVPSQPPASSTTTSAPPAVGPGPTTTTTTTVPPTTTSAPPTTSPWLLGTAGIGNTGSQAVLPFGATLQAGALPNFDTDRDSDAGLIVRRGLGNPEVDPTKSQLWSTPMDSIRVQGEARLDVWAAIPGFDLSKAGRMYVALYDCDASGQGCWFVGGAQIQFFQSFFGADFGYVRADIGPVDYTFAANRTMVLKVAPTTDSDDDIWLAYGSTAHPSALIIE